MVLSKACLGVHGLFRLGELWPPAKDRQVQWTDLEWHGDTHASLALHQSRTDPFKKGVTVMLFANSGDTCPVQALKRVAGKQREKYAAKRPNVLFARGRKGRPPNKEAMVKTLKVTVAKVAADTGLNLTSSDFAGHSLRRDGATSLALRGVEERLLQLMGRWKSDSYKLYLTTPMETFQSTAMMLQQTNPDLKERDLAAAAATEHAPPWVWNLGSGRHEANLRHEA
jgi:hypothetical protein